jgi:ribonuclease G
MSNLELLADEIDGRLHAAILRKGVLDDLYADAAATPARWGAIYLGKVSKVDTKLDAALVDLGGGITGFLPAKHVHHPGADKSESRTGISSRLAAGQVVMVQVKSEGRKASGKENEKLPRLTMKLYLHGLSLTYSPTSSQVTISRRVQNDKILALTAKLKGKGGWIVRHHIETAPAEEIGTEARRLEEAWEKIEAACAARGGKPGLLHEGPDALTRALTDYGIARMEHIYIGNKKLLDQAIAWCAAHAPSLAESKRLRLFKPETPGQSLFDIRDVHSALDALKDARVPLASGGSLIIERTSALTLIDVNQGSAGSIGEANLSAVPEVARQCRLRNLSGGILVDFINVTQKEERAKLQAALEESFVLDMAGTQVHGFTRLGIAELTRKRRTATLAEKLEK